MWKRSKEPCRLIGSKPYIIDIKSFIQTTTEPIKPTIQIESTTLNQIIIPENKIINSISDSDNNIKIEKYGLKKYLGIILALIGTMAYSLATLCITLLNKEYDPFNLSFWRFQGILLPSIPFIIYYRYYEKKLIFEPMWPICEFSKFKFALIIVVRSIFGCTSTLFHIYSLEYISMPDASVIMFSCPVFVGLVAHIYLGEKCGVTPIFVAIFTLCGVITITRPPMLTGSESFNLNTLIGTGLALAGMILNGIVFILIRYLRKVHFSFMMANYGFIGTLESLNVALFTYGIILPNGGIHWTLCGALIFFTFISQVCFVCALKFENAGPVCLMQSSDVIFAFLWQFIFFNIMPDELSACGAGIVILGVFLTTFQKWISTLPEDRKERKIFNFLLK